MIVGTPNGFGGIVCTVLKCWLPLAIVIISISVPTMIASRSVIRTSKPSDGAGAAGVEGRYGTGQCIVLAQLVELIEQTLNQVHFDGRRG
jgi:hypothetical protein